MASKHFDVKKIMEIILELENLLLLLDECSKKMLHLCSSVAENNLDSTQINLSDIEKKLGDVEALRTQVIKLCDMLRMLTDELLLSEELSEAFCSKRTELARLIEQNRVEAERLEEVKRDVQLLEAEMEEVIRKREILEAYKLKIECEARSRWDEIIKLEELNRQQEQRATEEKRQIKYLKERIEDNEKLCELNCLIKLGQDEERRRREKIQELEEKLAEFDNQVKCIQLDLGGDSYKLVKICDNKMQVELSKVQFSVLSPECFQKGKFGMIDVFMYEESYRKELDRLISEAENAIRETNSGAYIVEENARIRIVLTSPDVKIEDNEDLAVWSGRFLRFSYPVCVPKRYKKKQVQFAALIYINNVIASKIRFVANVSQNHFWNYHPAPKKQRLEITRKDIMSAFISYASKDRSRVAMVVQGIKKARPDLKVFFDVDSLKSGEYWENTIKKEIVARDIFYLFWSNAARESEWVEKEWRYALTQKGIDFIDPIAIDSPDTCPPPEELSKKHFNDRMLNYIF